MHREETVPGVKVVLRLCFVKLPGTSEPRIFRDAMFLAEPEDRSYEDVRSVVEKKLAFMEIPPSDFTVLHADPVTGDRIVVDDAYLSELIAGWFAERDARRRRRRRGRRPGSAAQSHSAQAEAHASSSRMLSVSQDGQQPSLVVPRMGSTETGGDGGRRPHRSHSCSSSGSSSHSSSDEASDTDRLDVQVSFDVEVGRRRLTPSATAAASLPPPPLQGAEPRGAGLGAVSCSDGSGGGGGCGGNPATAVANTNANAAPCVPLTVENLAALVRAGTAPLPQQQLLASASPAVISTGARVQPQPAPGDALSTSLEPLVRIGDLVWPPQPATFCLRAVPLGMRFKMPRAGVTVGELDLCDATDARQVITAVTFDASVQREMKEKLRCDARQVIELRGANVRRKNELDMRYATNAHPLLLRIDRNSRVEVVGVLPVPITSSAPVIVAAAMPAPGLPRGTGAGVLDVGHLARAGAGAGAAGSSTASSSIGPRRTTFTLASGCTAATAAPLSGVVPSVLGQQLQQRQQQLLAQSRTTDVARPPWEPGVTPVTARDVRSREDLIAQHVYREEARVARIRRRAEVSQACILCGLDLTPGDAVAEADSTAIVRRLLEASSRNRGNDIPTLDQLRDALSDHRRDGETRATTTRRLTCRATFVNLQTRTTHVVHARCAHLCSDYQAGGDLEDIAYCELPRQPCSLCGLSGACVACYHPDCREVYHVICALYSGGYVNFGKRDPHLPCPACPRHTQVTLSHGNAGARRGGSVLHVDESCWADGDIAFDSRVVAEGDLRDPDENDGE